MIKEKKEKDLKFIWNIYQIWKMVFKNYCKINWYFRI